ncbi:unnamed protein product [Closterium sp. NIES-64]|nr:unnamed protein product [Closterium sp. NIES-64]
MVNLAEAQKVFNLVQGLSKQQQFVKYISNAGLLSVLLESITKGNGAGATFLVPSPDALQSLPPASPYFNNPSLARTTLRYHMILGKQMDYTALVERPADTGFPTLAKESMFKSDESAFFTVVFRSGSGRSKSTLLAPNLAKTEFFQVHLVDSQLVPDAILHSVPDGGSAADGSDRSGGSSSGGDSTGAGSLSPPPSVPSPSVPSPPLNPSPPPLSRHLLPSTPHLLPLALPHPPLNLPLLLLSLRLPPLTPPLHLLLLNPLKPQPRPLPPLPLQPTSQPHPQHHRRPDSPPPLTPPLPHLSSSCLFAFLP